MERDWCLFISPVFWKSMPAFGSSFVKWNKSLMWPQVSQAVARTVTVLPSFTPSQSQSCFLHRKPKVNLVFLLRMVIMSQCSPAGFRCICPQEGAEPVCFLSAVFPPVCAEMAVQPRKLSPPGSYSRRKQPWESQE